MYRVEAALAARARQFPAAVAALLAESGAGRAAMLRALRDWFAAEGLEVAADDLDRLRTRARRG